MPRLPERRIGPALLHAIRQSPVVDEGLEGRIDEALIRQCSPGVPIEPVRDGVGGPLRCVDRCQDALGGDGIAAVCGVTDTEPPVSTGPLQTRTVGARSYRSTLGRVTKSTE